MSQILGIQIFGGLFDFVFLIELVHMQIIGLPGYQRAGIYRTEEMAEGM